MVDGNSDIRLDDDNPWPGLAAYTEAAQRYFHGRESDSAELMRLIRLSPYVALYGKSGLGKSSVLQAGLFPLLRAERFLPVYLRLDYAGKGDQPLMQQALQRLLQEIDAAGADAAAPEPGEGLWAYLQRREWPIWTQDNYPLTPVLVFDQFEEVFSRGATAEHMKAVLEVMADLVGDRLPAPMAENREAVRRLNLQSQQYRVLLSFRSDFLADVEAWEKLANLPRRESLHLTALSRERAVDAIERAGAKVLEPGVAQNIVDFLLNREGRGSSGRATEVEPVLMSLCCYQLNNRRKRPARIDTALLKTVGEGILRGFYEEGLAGMPARVAVFIEENLIQGERYRNAYALDGALASGALTQDELNTLTQRRLLRVDPQGEVPRIELIHDRLVGVVRESRDARRALEAQEQARLKAEQQALADREQAEKDAKARYDRQRLEEAEAERKRIARWRNGLAGAVALLLVAVGSLFYSQHKLSEAKLVAESRTQEAIKARALAESKADEAAGARDALKESLARAEEDLDKVRKAALDGLKSAVAETGASSGSAAPTLPVQAATAQVASATREVLTAVLAAERNIMASKESASREAAAVPSPSPAPAPVPSAAPGPAPAPVAATVPAPAAGTGGGTTVATKPTRTPAAAGFESGSTGARPTERTLTVRNFRLSSGGCLKGDVTVVGDAKFWIEPAGDSVIVRGRFDGKGNDGFTATVTDTGQLVPRSTQGFYDAQTDGEWSNPGGRKFKSTGTVRVFVEDGLLPVRASVRSFRTVCPT